MNERKEINQLLLEIKVMVVSEVSDLGDSEIPIKKKFLIDDFKEIRHLGKGSFGIVKLV
jgi:hypothetical protein